MISFNLIDWDTRDGRAVCTIYFADEMPGKVAERSLRLDQLVIDEDTVVTTAYPTARVMKITFRPGSREDRIRDIIEAVIKGLRELRLLQPDTRDTRFGTWP